MGCFSIITGAIENEAISLFDEWQYNLAHQEMILKVPYGIKMVDINVHAVVSMRLSFCLLVD